MLSSPSSVVVSCSATCWSHSLVSAPGIAEPSLMKLSSCCGTSWWALGRRMGGTAVYTSGILSIDLLEENASHSTTPLSSSLLCSSGCWNKITKPRYHGKNLKRLCYWGYGLSCLSKLSRRLGGHTAPSSRNRLHTAFARSADIRRNLS